MEVFREFIYAMFVDCKRMSLVSIANNTTINYQKLQYFFSESGWSIQGLNDIRIKILQNQRTTRANNKGILAVDDTACPKPHAQNTEGASVQYCSCLGKEENANVAVASCFISNSKHFPVDFKSYLPITYANVNNLKISYFQGPNHRIILAFLCSFEIVRNFYLPSFAFICQTFS